MTDVGGDVAAPLACLRVIVDPAIYLDDSHHAPPVGLLGSEADGGFATFVAVSAAQVHDVTDSPLPDEQLACLPVAYGTAMGMLESSGTACRRDDPGHRRLWRRRSGPRPAGRRPGATIVAITSGSKVIWVREAGASHVIARDAGDVAGQVAALAPLGWTR